MLHVPPLPCTFRPKWGRRVLYGMGSVMLLTFLAGAVVVPGGEGGWRLVDRLGLVLLGAGIAYVVHRIADVRIVCDEDGLTVVNIVRSRRLSWAEVLLVRLRGDDPWVVLDLSDGTSLAAMGVQGSDGEHARRQVAELAALVEAHGGAGT